MRPLQRAELLSDAQAELVQARGEIHVLQAHERFVEAADPVEILPAEPEHAAGQRRLVPDHDRDQVPCHVQRRTEDAEGHPAEPDGRAAADESAASQHFLDFAQRVFRHQTVRVDCHDDSAVRRPDPGVAYLRNAARIILDDDRAKTFRDLRRPVRAPVRHHDDLHAVCLTIGQGGRRELHGFQARREILLLIVRRNHDGYDWLPVHHSLASSFQCSKNSFKKTIASFFDYFKLRKELFDEVA